VNASEVPALVQRRATWNSTSRPDDGRGTDLAKARLAFANLEGLRVDQGLAECSMGMTDDLEVACEMGTSELRIGRALFGERVDHTAS